MKRFGSKQQRIAEIIFHPFDSSEPVRYPLSKEGKILKKMKRAIRVNYRKIEKQKAALKLKNSMVNNNDDCKGNSHPSSPTSNNEMNSNKLNKTSFLCIGGVFNIDININPVDYNQCHDENLIHECSNNNCKLSNLTISDSLNPE